MKNKIDTLADLLHLELQVLYDVEHELLKFVPRIAKKLKNPHLKKVVEEHASEIPGEIKKLEKMFNSLGLKPKKKKSEGIRGMITDAKWILTAPASAEARDAGLIGALQTMEHFEISAYGTAHAWAKQLGLTTIAQQLDWTGDEEAEADELLTRVAEQSVNAEVDR